MHKSRNTYAKMLCVGFAVALFLLSFNVAYLSISGRTLISQQNIREFANQRGDKQTVDVKQATRGTIYSSDNEIVASDVKKYKIIAILSSTRTQMVKGKEKPAYVVNKEKTAKLLSKYIDMSYKKILKKLQATSYQVEFGNAGSNLSSITKDKIQGEAAKNDLPGLIFEEMISRNYPYGDFASYEIGYASVNKDTDPYTIIGQTGLEKTYDKWLKGINGEKVYVSDANGSELPGSIVKETNAVNGNDVYLTINSALQTEVDSEFKKMCEETKTYDGAVAIMNVKTGEILAIANYPSFDPNKRDMDNYTDQFLSSAIEPGSTFKAYVFGSALSEKSIDLNTYYRSGNYKYMHAGRLIHVIKDHNEGVGWGTITYEQGFYMSSNVAICDMLEKHVNMAALISDYKDLGLFQKTNVDGMNVGSGVAGYDGKTKSLEYFTTGFGQGSSVTGYQMLRAYSAFANNGKMVKPHFVDKVVNPTTGEVLYQAETEYSKQIFTKSACKTMLKLLYGVVNRDTSTGSYYRMEDVELIGKTGTGQVAVNGRYSKTLYTHDFSGMAPYDDPQVSIFVWYQNKKGMVSRCAKFVKRVMKSALAVVNSREKTVEVKDNILPNYIGKNLSAVEKSITKRELTPIIISDGKKVKSQYPESGTKVTVGTRVFVLTNGKTIKMPDMKGWTRMEAEAYADLADIKLTFNGVGSIYKQSVKKDKTLKKDQKVKVYAK